jgi:hypothetical protein
MLLWSLVPVGAGAADLQVLPTVQVSGYYEDNYRLTEIRGEEIEVSGGIADVEVVLLSSTQTTEFSLTPRLVATYFPNDSSEDQNDAFLAAAVSRSGQRMDFALRANYQYEIVRDEFSATTLDGDLGEPLAGDISRVTTRNRRDIVQIAPSLSIDVAERTRVDVGATYSDVSFDRTVLFEQQDYRNLDIQAGVAFAATRTSVFSLTGSIADFKPQGVTSNSSDARTYGLAGEWAIQKTDAQRFYVRGGVKRTQSDVGAGAGDEDLATSYVGGVGGSWQFQVTNLFVDLGRDVRPNSTGRVVERDELRLRLTRAVTQRFDAVAGWRGTRSRSVDRNGFRDDREVVTGSVGFEWSVRPRLLVVGSYEYSWRDFSRDVADATSNAVLLGLAYKPQVAEPR